MCLIIASEKAQTILDTVTRQEIQNAAWRNKDGVGVMYFRKGKLVIEKYTPPTPAVIINNAAEAKTAHTPYVPPKSLTDFIMEHLTAADKDKPFASHLRFTTHGQNLDDNTHPHPVIVRADKVGKEIYMMHNGVISKHGSFDAKQEGDETHYSDTVRFNKFLLRPILMAAPNLLNEPAFDALMGDYIGTGSKLVFLDSDYNLTFVNEQQGTWRKDVWFSTISYINNYSQNYGRASAYDWDGYDGWQGHNRDNNGYDADGKKKHQHQNHTTQTTSTTPTTHTTGLVYVKGARPLGHCLIMNDVEKEVGRVKHLLTNLTPDIAHKILTDEWILKAEPNFDNKQLVQELRQAVEFTIDGLATFNDLHDFFTMCPEDAAELLHFLSKTYTFTGNEFDDIWADNDTENKVKPLVRELKTKNYVETVQAVLSDPETNAGLYWFLVNNFSYPWQKNYQGNK